MQEENFSDNLKASVFNNTSKESNFEATEVVNGTMGVSSYSLLETLKRKSSWVIWKGQQDGDRITKVPYSIKNEPTGTTPKYKNTWGTYQEAQEAKEFFSADGVGLVLTEGLCCIDIDHKGLDDPLVQDILNSMDSYAEASPSNQGFHVLFTVDVAKMPTELVNGSKRLDSKYFCKNSSLNIEIYIGGLTHRYITFTGKSINNRDVADRTKQAPVFLDKYMLRAPQVEDSNISNLEVGTLSNDNNMLSYDENSIDTSITEDVTVGNDDYLPKNDEAIIKVIMNSPHGETFKKLFYDGDISAYDGDESRAELALCQIFAYYVGNNPTRIYRLVKRSRLYEQSGSARITEK